MNLKNHLSLVPLKAAVARVLEYLPPHSASVDKLEEWAYQAYTSIAPHEVYSVNTAYLEVFNHKAPLPTMFNLEMVLYKEYDSLNITRTNPITNVKSTFTTTTDSTTGTTTDKLTNTTVTTKTTSLNVNLNSGSDTPLMQYDYTKDTASKLRVQLYHGDHTPQQMAWAPLPVSENIFHFTVLKGEQSMDCHHSFAVQNGCIVTSFSEGSLLIAYNSLPTNNEGEYVYVDHEDVSKALETMIMRNYWQWKWLTGSHESAHNKYMHFAQLSEVLAPKASAHIMMPNMIEYQNLRNLNKFIKEDSPFATQMGAMGNTETMRFGNLPRNSNASVYNVNHR